RHVELTPIFLEQLQLHTIAGSNSEDVRKGLGQNEPGLRYAYDVLFEVQNAAQLRARFATGNRDPPAAVAVADFDADIPERLGPQHPRQPFGAIERGEALAACEVDGGVLPLGPVERYVNHVLHRTYRPQRTNQDCDGEC